MTWLKEQVYKDIRTAAITRVSGQTTVSDVADHVGPQYDYTDVDACVGSLVEDGVVEPTGPHSVQLAQAVREADGQCGTLPEAVAAVNLDRNRDGDCEAEPADVADTDNTSSVSETPDDVLSDSAELYRQKNDDYGEAWRLAGETIALWADTAGVDTVDPTDERQMVSLCLWVQRLHKLVRGFNLEYSGDEPTFESVTESHRDELTYAAMHAVEAMQRGDDQ